MKLDGMLFNKYEDRDVSVYARTETIDEFVDEFDIEFEHIGQGEYYDMLNEEEYLILSRYFDYNDGEHWVLDPLRERFGQVYNECDVMLVEKGVAHVIDFKKVDYNEIDLFDGVVTYVEDEMEKDVELDFDNEGEYERDWLDDVANDILDALENMKKDECPHCIIKSYLETVETVIKNVSGKIMKEYIDDFIISE